MDKMIEQSTMWGEVNFRCNCGAHFEKNTEKCGKLHSVDVHHWVSLCPLCKESCKALNYYEKLF